MIPLTSDQGMNAVLDTMDKEELKELVKKLALNSGYGCFTRTGLEEIVWPRVWEQAEWMIFLDIDGLHALNAQYETYEPVNAMIFRALSVLRQHDIKAGQLNSGDEIIIILLKDKRRDKPVDPESVVGRLVVSFAKENMSATFAIVPVISPDLLTNLVPAIKQVKEIKDKRGGDKR